MEAKNVSDSGDKYWELNVLSLHVSKTSKLNINVHMVAIFSMIDAGGSGININKNLHNKFLSDSRIWRSLNCAL